MSKMVERVARAIVTRMGQDPDAPFRDNAGKAMDFPEWHRWEAEARAAIGAMREPTTAMLDAADRDSENGSYEYSYGTWYAMIDAALK